MTWIVILLSVRTLCKHPNSFFVWISTFKTNPVPHLWCKTCNFLKPYSTLFLKLKKNNLKKIKSPLCRWMAVTTARGRCWTPTGSLSGRIPRTSTAGPISFRSDSVGVFERILLVCHYFLLRLDVTFPCFYRSTYRYENRYKQQTIGLFVMSKLRRQPKLLTLCRKFAPCTTPSSRCSRTATPTGSGTAI